MALSIPAPCDSSLAERAPAPAVAHPALVLTATILASSLAFVDGSVVNVALPAIGRDLAGRAADLQWVVNAYLLPLSALLLLGGGAGDRFGRRRLLVSGIMLFAAASCLCAAAPGLEWLLAGRVLQGMGAAMLMPNSLAVLGTAFSGEARGRAIGTWAATAAIAGALGPLLGGWLVDAAGWRAIFLINLPIAAAAIVLIRRVVPETADADRPALDWAGGLLATAALGTMTWGLTIRSAGASEAGTLALAASALLFAAFLWAEWRRGETAMMPLALFASRGFVGLSLLTLALYGALGGLMVLLPYVLIAQGGYSALQAGAALLPFPLVIGLASRAMGRLAARTGPRLPLALGPLIVAAGFALALRIEGGSGDYWSEVLPCILVISLGMAGAVAPLTTAVLASVDSRHAGIASGFNSAVARSGGMIATALLGGALAAEGAGLIAAFHAAALVGAGAALAASASALLLPAGQTKEG